MRGPMDRLLDYFTKEPLLAGGLVLMTLVVLGYEIRQRVALASAIAPNEAIRLVNSGAVLVDLRAANQFKDGHIAGAKNVPGDQITTDPKALERLAAKTVVLYCGDGATTAAAQRALSRAGAKGIFSLRGGLAAWTKENLPVVKG
jgi:rhodanese-related sulfurtransferase